MMGGHNLEHTDLPSTSSFPLPLATINHPHLESSQGVHMTSLPHDRKELSHDQKESSHDLPKLLHNLQELSHEEPSHDRQDLSHDLQELLHDPPKGVGSQALTEQTHAPRVVVEEGQDRHGGDGIRSVTEKDNVALSLEVPSSPDRLSGVLQPLPVCEPTSTKSDRSSEVAPPLDDISITSLTNTSQLSPPRTPQLILTHHSSPPNSPLSSSSSSSSQEKSLSRAPTYFDLTKRDEHISVNSLDTSSDIEKELLDIMEGGGTSSAKPLNMEGESGKEGGRGKEGSESSESESAFRYIPSASVMGRSQASQSSLLKKRLSK